MPETTMSTMSMKPRQNPLTLVMTLKSPDDAAQLEAFLLHAASLPDNQNPVRLALNSIGTVHFARFTFLDNKTKIAIITDYDGDFEVYLRDFSSKIGPVFDAIFAHVIDAPPAPVKEHPEEFFAFVKANDAGAVSFYSAYPQLSVLDIRSMADSEG